ncbi:MAG: hypothetical protein H0T78_05100 [Longispora sp.]|nr:hypothetical protein [Longispora sp. (in: high G+C Gram-positive bacteria)]
MRTWATTAITAIVLIASQVGGHAPASAGRKVTEVKSDKANAGVEKQPVARKTKHTSKGPKRQALILDHPDEPVHQERFRWDDRGIVHVFTAEEFARVRQSHSINKVSVHMPLTSVEQDELEQNLNSGFYKLVELHPGAVLSAVTGGRVVVRGGEINTVTGGRVELDSGHVATVTGGLVIIDNGGKVGTVDITTTGKVQIYGGGTVDEVVNGDVEIYRSLITGLANRDPEVRCGRVKRVSGGKVAVYGSKVTEVSGGEVTINEGGVLSSVNGGKVTVNGGGIVSGVADGAIVDVYKGGNVILVIGGLIQVNKGGTVKDVYGGEFIVHNGGSVTLGLGVKVTVEDDRAYTAGSDPEHAPLRISGFAGKPFTLLSYDGTELYAGQ